MFEPSILVCTFFPSLTTYKQRKKLFFIFNSIKIYICTELTSLKTKKNSFHHQTLVLTSNTICSLYVARVVYSHHQTNIDQVPLFAKKKKRSRFLYITDVFFFFPATQYRYCSFILSYRRMCFSCI